MFLPCVRNRTITASNIANADTPGYKARFINFENILAEAVDANSDRLMTTRELILLAWTRTHQILRLRRWKPRHGFWTAIL